MLAAGQIAPDFTLSDQHGEELTLAELVAEGPVALVFFPLAFSGLCTGELCELRDNLSMFTDARVRLIGVSVDAVPALAAWAEAEGFDFTLLSDFWPHGGTATEYGVFVPDAGIATRATFVIGEGRTVHAAFETAPGQPRDLDAYRTALEALPAKA